MSNKLRIIAKGDWEQADALYKAACRLADTARSELVTTQGQLAKARGQSAPTVRDAIEKALRRPQPGAQNAWQLLPNMVAAQKSRVEHEGATPKERVAAAEALLRKASGR